METVFAKIIRKEIPSYTVYEDDNFLAFLDIRPMNLGHTLLIPKNWAQWVYEVDKQPEFWQVAQKFAKAMTQKLGANYVMYITWGIEVAHAHLHLIPRYEDDDFEGFPDFTKPKEFSNDKMQETADTLRAALQSES